MASVYGREPDSVRRVTRHAFSGSSVAGEGRHVTHLAEFCSSQRAGGSHRD